MDYKRIYDQLIEKAKERELPAGVYSERHHVVPRCMGGGDEEGNLVRLTYREHVMAHILLAKTYGGVPDVGGKLKLAVALMLSVDRNGKEVGRVSLRYIETARGCLALNKGGVSYVDVETGKRRYFKEGSEIPTGYTIGAKEVSDERKQCKHCNKPHAKQQSDFCSSNCELRFKAKQRIADYDGSLRAPKHGGQNRKSVVLYGVEFPSMATAAAVSGMTVKCIRRIMNRGVEDVDLNNSCKAKKTIINGVLFGSISQASREVGIHYKKAKRFVVC